jgi:hypothetical protein
MYKYVVTSPLETNGNCNNGSFLFSSHLQKIKNSELFRGDKNPDN